MACMQDVNLASGSKRPPNEPVAVWEAKYWERWQRWPFSHGMATIIGEIVRSCYIQEGCNAPLGIYEAVLASP